MLRVIHPDHESGYHDQDQSGMLTIREPNTWVLLRDLEERCRDQDQISALKVCETNGEPAWDPRPTSAAAAARPVHSGPSELVPVPPVPVPPVPVPPAPVPLPDGLAPREAGEDGITGS
jgi:hypothetical protein